MPIGNTRVIALEEHYWDAEVASYFDPNDPNTTRSPDVLKRLNDLGEMRLREMDEAGIDLQVISHGAPSVQRLPDDVAVDLAQRANDRLHEVILKHPDRFAGFAVIPTPDPEAGARELERAVKQLGFKGAMVHGQTNGLFFDDRRFWPICEVAQNLDVPLYLHPAVPNQTVIDTYYQPYVSDFPHFIRSAWGFTVETATQGIRMVLSGVFQAYPELKVILGHMGEGLPFYLWRIDEGLARGGNKPMPSFRETFCRHFWITTSGFFSTPALLCSMMEMGVDHVMFSIDYPFVENPPGTAWFEHVQLSPEDRARILNGNATRLLRL